jgi:hypothetical protein
MEAISGGDIKADDKPRNTRNTRNEGKMKSQRDFIIQPGVDASAATPGNKPQKHSQL